MEDLTPEKKEGIKENRRPRIIFEVEGGGEEIVMKDRVMKWWE